MAVFSHVAPEFTTLNLPKPVFTAVLAAWLAVAGVHGIVQSVRGAGPLLSWLGLIIGVAGPVSFLVRTRLLASPQTRHVAFTHSIVCALGLALAMAMSYRYGPAAGNAHVWAGITLLAWLVYLRWFSAVPRT